MQYGTEWYLEQYLQTLFMQHAGIMNAVRYKAYLQLLFKAFHATCILLNLGTVARPAFSL